MDGGVEFRQFNVLLSECVARGQQNGIDCSRIEEEAASLFFVDALENREFGKRGLFPEHVEAFREYINQEPYCNS